MLFLYRAVEKERFRDDVLWEMADAGDFGGSLVKKNANESIYQGLS